MRPDLCIQAEGIGKQYRVGAMPNGYGTIPESIMNLSRNAASSLRGGFKPFGLQRGKNSFWALEDVSFEVKRGEVVRVIGCNGAGKRILLKVLSRITDPTTRVLEAIRRQVMEKRVR